MRWILRLFKSLIIVMASLLGLLVCVSVGAYLLLPWLLPPIATSLLPEGLVLEELAIERPQLDRLNIPSIRLKYSSATAEMANISVSGAVVKYTWRQLLEGRIESVNVELVRLLLPEKYVAANNSANDSDQSLNELLPSALLGKLPLSAFNVRRLSLRRIGFPHYENWHGAARLNEGLLDLSLKSGESEGWFFKGKASDTNELDFIVWKHGKRIARMSTNVSRAEKDGSEVTGRGEVNSSELSPLLHDLTILDPNINLSGQIESSWLLSLPGTLDQLNAESIVLNGSVNGAFEASISELGDISCSTPADGSLPSLTEYEWSGEVILFRNLGLHCSGEIDAAIVPEVASNFDLKRALEYQLAFSDDTLLRLNLNERTAKQGQGSLQLSFSQKGIRERKSRNKSFLAGSANITNGRFSAGTDIGSSIASLTLETQLDLGHLALPPYSARGLAVKGSGELKLAGDVLELALEPGATLSANRVRWLNGGTSRLQLTIDKELRVKNSSNAIVLGETSLSLSGTPIHAFGPRLEYKVLTLSSNGIKVIAESEQVEESANGAQFKGDMRLRGKGLLASYKGLQTHGMLFNMDMTTAGTQLNGKLRIVPEGDSSAEEFKLIANFRHDIHSNIGRATVTTPKMRFSESNTFLPQLVQHWPYPVDLSAGALTFTSQIKWQRGKAGSDSEMKFEDLGGFYERNLFHGTNGSLHARFLNGTFDVTSKQLIINKLEAGFNATNIRIDLRPLSNPQQAEKHIVSLDADTLGGTLKVEDLILDPDQDKHSFDVHLAGIKLNELLQLESGVTGNGVLDAQLPVVIATDGVSMSDGQVTGRAPGGVIKYTGELPKAALDSNPQLSLALNALKNFHYTVLDMQTTYTKSGKLTLKTRLEGRNPDLTNGRPIHFNLNITEDIPALLKSLQLSQDISDKLDARIQQLSR